MIRWPCLIEYFFNITLEEATSSHSHAIFDLLSIHDSAPTEYSPKLYFSNLLQQKVPVTKIPTIQKENQAFCIIVSSYFLSIALSSQEIWAKKSRMNGKARWQITGCYPKWLIKGKKRLTAN